MDKRPIGVFDSGLGGLTAVKALRRLLPGEDIVYFGDTGRVPYGPRGRAVIARYAAEDAAFLLRHDVKAVLCACGTVSSVAGAALAERMPCPFFTVVEPAARAACAATRNGKIGAVGTKATIGSGSFARAIERIAPGCTVFSRACPLFVPLVEAGHLSGDPLTALAVEEYLAPVAGAGVDTLILGCTHYPILAPAIAAFMGKQVTLIDSGAAAAAQTAEILAAENLLSGCAEGGKTAYFVTDAPDDFAATAGIFLGEDLHGEVIQIDISQLETPAAGAI